MAVEFFLAVEEEPEWGSEGKEEEGAMAAAAALNGGRWNEDGGTAAPVKW